MQSRASHVLAQLCPQAWAQRRKAPSWHLGVGVQLLCRSQPTAGRQQGLRPSQISQLGAWWAVPRGTAHPWSTGPATASLKTCSQSGCWHWDTDRLGRMRWLEDNAPATPAGLPLLLLLWPAGVVDPGVHLMPRCFPCAMSNPMHMQRAIPREDQHALGPSQRDHQAGGHPRAFPAGGRRGGLGMARTVGRLGVEVGPGKTMLTTPCCTA